MAPFSDYAVSPNAYPRPLTDAEREFLEADRARRLQARAARAAAGAARAGKPRVRSAETPQPERERPPVPRSAEPEVAKEKREELPAASPAERQSARQLLTSIGQKFAENRQKSKSKAFEIYQRDLATNSGALVMGGAVTLKELTVLLMDLEGFVKSTQKEGETPATLLGQFLRGEIDITE